MADEDIVYELEMVKRSVDGLEDKLNTIIRVLEEISGSLTNIEFNTSKSE